MQDINYANNMCNACVQVAIRDCRDALNKVAEILYILSLYYTSITIPSLCILSSIESINTFDTDVTALISMWQ